MQRFLEPYEQSKQVKRSLAMPQKMSLEKEVFSQRGWMLLLYNAVVPTRAYVFDISYFVLTAFEE